MQHDESPNPGEDSRAAALRKMRQQMDELCKTMEQQEDAAAALLECSPEDLAAAYDPGARSAHTTRDT